MATLTFGSHLPLGINRLDAKFGLPLEKNFPRFIHGMSSSANVTSSDKRGKVDTWGLTGNLFQDFTDAYPEQMAWGQGASEMVGVPNSMDVSQLYGSLFGCGTPGGPNYFHSVEEKRGRILDPVIHDYGHATLGLPQIYVQTMCTSSVWIAKTPAIPTMTRGLIGMLVGTSTGIVSAYSIGMTGVPRGDKLGRGDLTARWMLSPGVPIVALSADDNFSEERSHVKRIWAVALNALGEVFYMTDIPFVETTSLYGVHDHAWQIREPRAWKTGYEVPWKLVRPTMRQARHLSDQGKETSWFPVRVSGVDIPEEDLYTETTRLEVLLRKRPIDVREEFTGYDMRRRLHVDFAGDDARHGGESVLVVDCGYVEDVPAAIRRYTRCRFIDDSVDLSKGKDGAQHNFGEWRMSHLTLGRFKNVVVSAAAMDLSKNAIVTTSEEPTINRSRPSVERHTDTGKAAVAAADATNQFSPFRLPGQRARLFALGTAAGTVLVWDVRAAIPVSSSLSNSVAPLRIIHTDSPEISCLALSSLYLVHGGTEGLVQAWDPLASTLAPIRTLSSRSTLNARRRAVIAESSDVILQNQFSAFHAAKAICLDPDPTVLRGVVAIGAHLRYWSYSSETAADELNKSQKRRMRRSARGLNATSGDNFPAARRVGLKSFVERERQRRDLDEKDAEAEEREEARIAKRFGFDLLGREASEEEMVAYATMLSEEDAENKQRQAFEHGFFIDGTDDDAIEAFKNGLSEADYERWKFASWRERLSMPHPETGSSTLRSPESHAPLDKPSEVDADIAEAIRLSLVEAGDTEDKPGRGNCNDDGAEVVMVAAISNPGTSENNHPAVVDTAGSSESHNHIDEDMAKAVELSFQLNGDASPFASPWSNPDRNLERRRSSVSNTEDYPPLASMAAESPSFIKRITKKGKGRG